MGQHFDGIYTGFVASEAQIDQIFHFIDDISHIKTLSYWWIRSWEMMVSKYDMFTPKLLEKMKALAGSC